MDIKLLFLKWVSCADSFYQWVNKEKKTMFDDYHSAVNLVGCVLGINSITLLLTIEFFVSVNASDKLFTLSGFIPWLIIVGLGFLFSQNYNEEKTIHHKKGRIFLLYIATSLLMLIVVGYLVKNKS